MRLKKPGLVLAIFFLASNAGAGAWDAGPFDNDDALDWVWELESSVDLSAVEAALKAAANGGSYLEAPTGSAAIAAAEVVAALLGNPHPQLPDEIRSWVNDRSLAKDDKLVELARKRLRVFRTLPIRSWRNCGPNPEKFLTTGNPVFLICSDACNNSPRTMRWINIARLTPQFSRRQPPLRKPNTSTFERQLP